MSLPPYDQIKESTEALDMLDFSDVPEGQIRDAIAVVGQDPALTMRVDWLRAAVYKEMQDDYVDEHRAQIRVLHGLYACVPMTPAQYVSEVGISQPHTFEEAIALFEDLRFLHAFGSYIKASHFQYCRHPCRGLAFLRDEHTAERPYIEPRTYEETLAAFGLKRNNSLDEAAYFYSYQVEWRMPSAESIRIKMAHKNVLNGHRNRIY